MPRSIKVRQWNSFNDEALSEAAVRARFSSAKYRVSAYRYPAGTRFSGAMQPATCHILSGSCRYVFESAVTVQAGDVAALPKGHYSLEVLGEDELFLILCWELPFEFNDVQ